MLSGLLQAASLRPAAQKLVLGRSNLCAGFVRPVRLGSRSELRRHFRCPGTNQLGCSGSGQGGQGCADAPLFPLAPFVRRPKAPDPAPVEPGCGQAEAPRRSSARPPEVGDRSTGARAPHRRAPLLPEGSLGFPDFSVPSPPLVCCQKLFIQCSVASQK